MEKAEPLAVRVAFSPRAGVVDEVELQLPEGATIGDAIVASGLVQRHAALDPAVLVAGVWGKVRAGEEPVRNGDRVELYRPLSVDPKEARRQRYKAHLAKYPPK